MQDNAIIEMLFFIRHTFLVKLCFCSQFTKNILQLQISTSAQKNLFLGAIFGFFGIFVIHKKKNSHEQTTYIHNQRRRRQCTRTPSSHPNRTTLRLSGGYRARTGTVRQVARHHHVLATIPAQSSQRARPRHLRFLGHACRLRQDGFRPSAQGREG